MDISAVGPFMVRVAGEVADGVHVHAMHSMHYIKTHLVPGLADGAARAGRDPATIDKVIHVIVAVGDTPEVRAVPVKEAKTALAFYGAAPNYAFQFDDLGHRGLCDQLRDCFRTGDTARSQALITDEILNQFAIVARWDDVADRMIERYNGIASRLVIYPNASGQDVDAETFERWGEVARAVRQASWTATDVREGGSFGKFASSQPSQRRRRRKTNRVLAEENPGSRSLPPPFERKTWLGVRAS